MQRIRSATAVAVAASLSFFAACSGADDDVVVTPPQMTGSGTAAITPPHGRAAAKVCPGPAAPGNARCHAEVVVDERGEPAFTNAPTGYTPAQLRLAYNLPGIDSNASIGSQVIALVDAYDYPNAESDLAVYRTQFGLPPCTSASGCFRKLNQNGQKSPLPRSDSGWSQESALDLQMASAICPTCKLVLVEAKSNSFANLGTAVNTAAALGGTSAISNSYGASEFSSETTYATTYYNHPGIPVTASSGDGSYGVEFPAAANTVIAVGGTSLAVAAGTSRGWTETVWSGAGSGCSAYFAKPSWQTDTGCAKRTVADVSAVANPNTGVSVYWTQKGRGGWVVFGGTSVSSPIIAGFYAAAANGAGPEYPYSHTSALYDVTSGSNGSCGGSYLCTATTGYDGPTGLGTPNGTDAF